jgi:hypothetical protein
MSAQPRALTAREFAEVVQVWRGVMRLARAHGLYAAWQEQQSRSSLVAKARVQRREVVGERAGGTPQPKGQSANLGDATDYDALARKPFLTVPEAMAYVGGFSTAHAFRMWVYRHAVPRGRVGRSLRFRRRDLDRAINAQPPGEPSAHAHVS